MCASCAIFQVSYKKPPVSPMKTRPPKSQLKPKSVHKSVVNIDISESPAMRAAPILRRKSTLGVVVNTVKKKQEALLKPITGSIGEGRLFHEITTH